MGRRRRNDLDDLLEAWARWCHSGGVVPGSGASMLAKMIDGKGLITFGSGGGSAPMDSIEARIEAAVMKMAAENQDRADVLRLECRAGWFRVSQRRGLVNFDPSGLLQIDMAHALGMSLRTYKRRLAEAREEIIQELERGSS